MKHMGKGLALILALCMAISGVLASAPGCNTVKARESEGDTWVEHTDGKSAIAVWRKSRFPRGL